MISNRLTHPEILSSLAGAGHGSTVLITDGHYAATTATGPNARIVHLNLQAGTPTVPEVLEVVLETIAVERAIRISPSPDAMPCLVHDEIDRLLPATVITDFFEKSDFYALARSQNLALCIVTGDSRRFANVLLTVGVLQRP